VVGNKEASGAHQAPDARVQPEISTRLVVEPCARGRLDPRTSAVLATHGQMSYFINRPQLSPYKRYGPTSRESDGAISWGRALGHAQTSCGCRA